MEPAPPKNPLSTLRITLLLAGGYFLGVVVAGALCMRQPKIYEAKAMIESPDHSGHARRITPLRAQMVAREIVLKNRWVIPFDEVVASVENSVQLKTSPQGVLVEARSYDPRIAQKIAGEVAKWLDTPQREAEMAAKGLEVRPFTKLHLDDFQNADRLEWLLQDQSIQANYPSCFHLVEQAAGGDGKAASIVKSEDFSRRWKMFQELSQKIGYLNPQGEPFKGPNTSAKIGEVPTEPASPKISLWLNSGRFGGVALAGLSLLALGRWKPAFLRPYPRKVPGPKPPPAVDEDEW